MKKIILFFLLSLSTLPAQAQKGIQGHWEGTITYGGHDLKPGYKFEIHFDVTGRVVEGKTIIYKSDTEVISQSFKGRIFDDNSIAIEELSDKKGRLQKIDSLSTVPILRKYQLIYRRSIFGNDMEGWWQDININPFDNTRGRGRVYLKKTDTGKA